VFICTPKGWRGYIVVLSAMQINQKCWQLLKIFLSKLRMLTEYLPHHPRRTALANDLQQNEFGFPCECAV
jgi:hypothetical protein